jgi:hypothetical protein
LALKNHFLPSSSPKITTLKIIESSNQNQVNKFNCLCHVFSQVTYVCSRGYKSISSATHEEFPKITKFVSWHHFAKPIHFQNKTKLDPSYDTLRSLLINWLNKVRCLESIGMLKSTQKYEKTRFWDSAELTRSRRQDTRSCDPLQGTLTRSCHPDTRSCHSTSTAKMKFYVFVHKILFSNPISVPFSPMHS